MCFYCGFRILVAFAPRSPAYHRFISFDLLTNVIFALSAKSSLKTSEESLLQKQLASKLGNTQMCALPRQAYHQVET